MTEHVNKIAVSICVHVLALQSLIAHCLQAAMVPYSILHTCFECRSAGTTAA